MTENTFLVSNEDKYCPEHFP